MKFLPLFPLRLVVFPGETLNLHIFEPRYIQLINECETGGITFGIPAHIANTLREIGTEMKLLRVEKRYENGRMDISTQGTAPFQTRQFYLKVKGRLYGGADVDPFAFDLNADPSRSVQLFGYLKELYSFLQMDLPKRMEQSNFTTFDIGHICGLSLEQEYELLGISSEKERQDFLIHHVRQLLPIVQNMQALRQRIKSNGHFRNLESPDLG